MTITIREPGSAITHLAGMIITFFAAFPLMVRAGRCGSLRVIIGISIFIGSMILLYLASTVYHSVTVCTRVLKTFRKIDHMMIFILIAGSYTPICLIVLDDVKGTVLLAVIWGLALVGMTVKFLWITCPKWFSSLIYIGMGWACVFVLPDLMRLLTPSAFKWLLAGGIIYTIGGVVYALSRPLFPQRKNFGNHELFHVFVMAGSICHIVCMCCILSPLPLAM